MRHLCLKVGQQHTNIPPTSRQKSIGTENAVLILRLKTENKKLRSIQPDVTYNLKPTFTAFCYAWYREPDYLYVGQTKVGIQRIHVHHIINKVEPVQDNDELHIWFCDVEELNDTEYELIQILKPFYQTPAGYNKRGCHFMVRRYPNLFKNFK